MVLNIQLFAECGNKGLIQGVFILSIKFIGLSSNAVLSKHIEHPSHMLNYSLFVFLYDLCGTSFIHAAIF